MKETRRKITLPSGATCTVRKLSGYDFVHLGTLPPEAREEINRRFTDAQEARAVVEGFRLVKLSLTRACSVLTLTDGAKRRIVDKEFSACEDNEISIEELSDEDARAITAAIQELSGLTKEAVAAVKPFPQEQVSGDQPPQAGEDLRQAAD
jgi:hypothetical protein